MSSEESESSSGEEEPLATYIPKSAKAPSDLSAASKARPAIAPIQWLDRLKGRRKFRKVSSCIRAVRNALSVDGGISHAQLSDLEAAIANIAALPGFLLPTVYRLDFDLTAHLSAKADQASDALLSRKLEKSKATGGWATARVALQQRTFPVEDLQFEPVSKLLNAVETELLSDSIGIIDLSYCSLTDMPPDLIDLQSIIRYYLSFDQKEDLAALVLRRFWHVDLSYNQLHSIPNAFAATFEHITYLDIRGNNFRAFPLALIGFKHLHRLRVDHPEVATPNYIELNLGNPDSLLATCAHLLCREMEEDSALSSLLPVHLQDLGKTDYYSCDACQAFVTPFNTPHLYDDTTQINILHRPRDYDGWSPSPGMLATAFARVGFKRQDLCHLAKHRKHKTFWLPTRLCKACWAKHRAGEEACCCQFCTQQPEGKMDVKDIQEWPVWILVNDED